MRIWPRRRSARRTSAGGGVTGDARRHARFHVDSTLCRRGPRRSLIRRVGRRVELRRASCVPHRGPRRRRAAGHQRPRHDSTCAKRATTTTSRGPSATAPVPMKRTRGSGYRASKGWRSVHSSRAAGPNGSRSTGPKCSDGNDLGEARSRSRRPGCRRSRRGGPRAGRGAAPPGRRAGGPPPPAPMLVRVRSRFAVQPTCSQPPRPALIDSAWAKFSEAA